MKYTKLPLSIPDQISKLESRGMVFRNLSEKAVATDFLLHNSYYRFSIYAFSFQDRKDSKHLFVSGTHFEDVLNLYYFDSELRALLMKSISKIEIAFRTQIINEYSLVHSGHWHLNAALFKKPKIVTKKINGHIISTYHDYFSKFLNSQLKGIDRSQEEFIIHYYKKYTYPEIPPSWMCLETLSFGDLSFLYANLDESTGPKINIAKHFGLNTTQLMSKWIHSMHIIRNICAHHGRLWSKAIPVDVLSPNDAGQNIMNQFVNVIQKDPRDRARIYSSLCCIQYLLDIIEKDNEFRMELKSLMKMLPASKRGEMGFVKNWENEPFWK
jgi:Abortive infection bacteriophage resistance protein